MALAQWGPSGVVASLEPPGRPWLRALAPAALGAQELPDSLPRVRPQQRPDTSILPQPPISPGSAFLRALLVPGWGHASLGSYTRGGFYFATESLAALMMVRVSHRRSAAEAVRDLRIDEVEERARAEGITSPEEIQALVDADEGVEDAERLVEARSQQFEDWLALGIFLVLLGGADAYVSAHLSGFPEPVDVRPAVTGPGRFGVEVSVPLGGPPGH